MASSFKDGAIRHDNTLYKLLSLTSAARLVFESLVSASPISAHDGFPLRLSIVEEFGTIISKKLGSYFDFRLKK
jgi:hypothetical protein